MYPVYDYIGSETKCEDVKIAFPKQHQYVQPGLEYLMCPRPISENPDYCGSGKLKGKVAIVTGGDSGIGRAVSYAFAKEGADLSILYFDEHIDAAETKQRVEEIGTQCMLISTDLKSEDLCKSAVQKTMDHFGKMTYWSTTTLYSSLETI